MDHRRHAMQYSMIYCVYMHTDDCIQVYKMHTRQIKVGTVVSCSLSLSTVSLSIATYRCNFTGALQRLNCTLKLDRYV